jgi:hypothetical protein
MRTNAIVLIFVILIFVAATSITATEETVSVMLRMKHNGKVQPPPSQVTFEFDGQSRQLPVRNGLLQLPPEIRAAKSVSISFKLQREQIRIPGINLSKFDGGSWTILLADKSFGDDYRWAIRKGARIRSSCIWFFEPTGAEGTATFVEDCRIKLPDKWIGTVLVNGDPLDPSQLVDFKPPAAALPTPHSYLCTGIARQLGPHSLFQGLCR